MSRWILGAAMALVGVLTSSFWVSAASAQTLTHAAYIDLDNNPASGCSTTTAAGVIAGIEARITATVSGQPPMVTAVSRELCAGVAFGPPQAQAAGYPVGLNNGIGGADVVEWSTPLSGLGLSSSAASRIVFVSSSATGADQVVANGVILQGTTATGFGTPALIPATGLLAALLMIGLVLWLVRRHPRFGSSLALLLLLGAGLVWAANFVTDGQVGDWVGVSPRASDPANDPTSPESSIDLVAAFAETEAGTLFLRVDVRDAQTQAPTITSANNTTFTVGVAGTFGVNSTGVPTAALSIGCTPALPPSVTFTDNANGTATLAGTSATGTANTYACTITANNGIPPNATQSFTLTIARANTTTALTAAPNPSALGQAVTFTATVTTSSTLTPAGSVSFMDGATLLGTATLNGSGVATLTTSTLTPGTHPVSAIYAGNVDFNGSTSNTVSQIVDPAATTTTLSAAPNPSVFGQSVTLTATINETAPVTPTGTVTFFDGATNLGTATLVAGVASLQTNALATGSHPLTAVYAGDANFTGSTSIVVTQVVNSAATSTALASSANPSVFGQPVTFTATVSVTAPGAGTPTGTVTFFDGATSLGTVALVAGQASVTPGSLTLGTHPITATFNGTADFASSTSAPLNQVVNQAATTTALTSDTNPSIVGQAVTFTATVTATAPGAGTPSGTVTFFDAATPLVTVALNGSGVATFTTSTLTQGTHPITAAYSGSANFTTSTSAAVSQVVNLAGSTTTVLSNVNPSVFGQTVTFTATVTATPPAVGTPTGTVTFTDGAVTLATVALNGSGIATFSTSLLAVGTHPITASYSGDANFGLSNGTLSQVVNQGTTTTTVVSNINPSVVGQSVTFTATVSVNAPASGTPTGTVTFFDGATNLGTGTLNGAGQASVSVSSLPVGNRSITAAYSGDTNFATSTSSPLTQTVNAATTTMTLVSSTNPSVFGQSVTFTATVTPNAPSAGTPTGTVTFFDGPTNLGTDTLDGSGVATLTVATLSVATHTISANYATDGNYLASSDTVTQVVNSAATTTTLTSDLNPSVVGQPVTFTATVSAQAPGSGTPTGTVTFFDGPTPIGSDTLDGAGIATLTTSALSGGAHPITAQYATDGSYASSTSNLVTQNVDGPPAVTTVAPLDAATQVPTNATLTINFNENVSITGTGVTLDCGGNIALTGLPANNVNMVTLTPSVPLPAGTLCTATVLAASVSDFDAIDPPDNLAADFVWSFTTDQAPSVTATTPSNGAVDQSSSTNLTVTFSEPVNATGGSFTLSCATSGSHTFALSGGTTTFTLNPDTDFTGGETCTATVLAAQVTDQDASDPPDNMAANFVWSFTMDQAPSVSTTTPMNGATNVAGNANLDLTFSESVNFTTGSATISCATSGAHTFTIGGSPSSSFTLNPDTDFASNELCTVTVLAAQVTDADGIDPPDTMVANFVFAFTTDAAPTVTTTTPSNGAVGAPDTNVSITFSEPVDATGSSFTVNCTVSGAHTYVLGGNPTTYTLNPNTDFTAGETCTVTVIAAQVSDQDAGDPPDNMLADFMFSFAIDGAPSVLSTTPGDGAVDQTTNTTIQIVYDEPVTAGGSAYALECPIGNARTFVLSGNGTATHTLTPTLALPTGTSCTVTVTATQITDVDANDPPDQMAANYVFSFSTDAEPSVTATTPTNGDTGVAGNANIDLTFSESVNFTTGSATISCATSGAHVFTIGASPSATFTLNPTVDFVAGELCTVTVLAAQVTDADNNDPPNTMAANFVFSFTTDAAPSVTATTPINSATQVASTANLTLTFSEAVTGTGDWFQIACATSGTRNVAATLVSGGPTTFTIDPTLDFASGEVCTVTVFAAQVTDQDNDDPPDNPAANFVFSFTIDQAPSVTTTTPTNGASNVLPTSTITVNFSESVNATLGSFTVECPVGAAQTFTLSASPSASFVLTPTSNLPAGNTCTVTVLAAGITDVDAGDPPDTLAADFVFSFVVPAIANDDSYNATPHLTLNIAAGVQSGLVTTNDLLGPAVITGFGPPGNCNANPPGASAATQLSGSATLAANGSFAYRPPVATRATTDSFCYTVTGGDTATVSLVLANTAFVWFVDAAAGAGGTGTQAAPFQQFGGGAGTFEGSAADLAGDTVFIKQGAYTGGVTLLANQELVGDGAGSTLQAISGVTPVAGSAFPTFTNTAPVLTTPAGNDNIVLSANNTVRGLTLGDSGGASGDASDLLGNGFTGVTLGEMTFNGTGRTLNLTTGGVTMAGTGILNLISTASTGGGLSLNQIAGTITVAAAGATTITTTAAGATGINIVSSGATINLDDTTVTKSGTGSGVNLNADTGTITFNTLAISTTAGTALTADTCTSVVVTNSAGSTISATGGPAVNSSGTGWSATFTSTTSSGSTTQGVNLNNITGALNLGTGSLATNAAGTTFLGQGTLGTTSYGGTVNKTNAGKLVTLSGAGATTSVTLSGTLTCNGGCTGLDVLNRNAGTYTFSGGTKALNTGTNPGVTLTGNAGATIDFTNGGLDIDTTTGAGFTATGGGTVTVQTGAGNNTIDTGSGTAINVDNTTIGGLGITLRSVNSSGGTNGIILNTTGVGAFGVTGDGTNARNGTGGTITAKTGDAVQLTSAQNVTLRSMNLTSNGSNPALAVDAQGANGNHTIQIVGGQNVVLSGVLIQNTLGTGILALDLGGTNRLNLNSRIENLAAGAGHGIFMTNTSTTMTLFEMNNVQMVNNNASFTNAFFVTGGSGNMTLSVANGCLFEDLGVQALTVGGGPGAAITGVMTSTITGNTFRNGKAVAGVNVGENNVGILTNGGTHNATVSNNTFSNIAEDGSIANTSIVRTQNSGGVMTAAVTGNTIQNIDFPAGGRHAIGHIFEPVAFTASDRSNLNFSGNTVNNITYVGNNREAVFIDYRLNASAGNVRVQNNNVTTATAGAQQAIELRFRQANASTVNVLVAGNTISHNTAASLLDVDAEAAATVNLTVNGNNNFTNPNATPGQFIDTASEAAGAAMCANVATNTLQGGAGTITLNEAAGTFSIPQANGNQVASANGIPNGNVTVVGTLTFNAAACTLPP